MVHWPPQPCVEDEVTSLEHEQISPEMVDELKSDDDPAVSRGAVDQTPIIDETVNVKNTFETGVKVNVKPKARSSEINSSDDSAGPTTPPPIHRYEAQRQSSTIRPKGVSFEDSTRAPRATSSADQTSRGRPQISRIDTTLGADLQAMATGDRRPPSPYSYTRNSASKVSPAEQPYTASSSSKSKSSIARDDSVPNMRFSPNSPAEARAVLSDEPDTAGRERRRHRSKSRGRSRSHPREHSSRRRLSESSSGDESKYQHRNRKEGLNGPPPTRAQKYSAERETFTPPHSRRQSKDSYYPSAGEEYGRRTSRHRRSGRQSRESPYTSSAEEATYNGTRKERTMDDQQHPSTHRRERPRLDKFPDSIRSRKPSRVGSDDMATLAKEGRRRGTLDPMTPLTADAAKSMEDYFELAFKNNDARRHNMDRVYRANGSAVASPLTSPPRTPRSERQSRDYFDIDPPQRPSQRSRPPSVDEGQLSALKAHASLLSAATTGAALAARGTSDQNYSSRMGNSPRSSKTFSAQDDRTSQTHASTGPQAEYFRSAQGLSPILDKPMGLPHPHVPHRSASYSGYDHPKSILKAQGNPTLDNSRGHPMSVPHHPLSGGARPVVQGPQPADSLSPSGNDLRLPKCPRSKPVAGYHDWYSIKEMSNLDICPTCMNVLRTTRFAPLFVPSLPRPYNEPSFCAMSKPWLRIAFMRACRQRRSDLNALRALSTLPTDTRACAGSKPDIRAWFHIIDPATREAIPNFAACSACVRAVDIVFPELHRLLDRRSGTLNQEKVCSLHIDSKHFTLFINQFEQAATRCRGHSWRSADIQPLVNTIRKACRYQECCRDKFLAIRTWHFMPELPEFTICEDCYDEVVWPVSDKPIARDVSKTTRLVPVRRNSAGDVGISCQLYSERMRKIFLNAVATRTFTPLRDAAKTRQATQLRLHEMNKLYEADQKYGIDRRSEIGKNNAIWRNLE